MEGIGERFVYRSQHPIRRGNEHEKHARQTQHFYLNANPINSGRAQGADTDQAISAAHAALFLCRAAPAGRN